MLMWGRRLDLGCVNSLDSAKSGPRHDRDPGVIPSPCVPRTRRHSGPIRTGGSRLVDRRCPSVEGSSGPGPSRETFHTPSEIRTVGTRWRTRSSHKWEPGSRRLGPERDPCDRVRRRVTGSVRLVRSHSTLTSPAVYRVRDRLEYPGEPVPGLVRPPGRGSKRCGSTPADSCPWEPDCKFVVHHLNHSSTVRARLGPCLGS